MANLSTIASAASALALALLSCAGADETPEEDRCLAVSALRFDPVEACFHDWETLSGVCEYLPDNHGSYTSDGCFVDATGTAYISPGYNYISDLRGNGWNVWLGDQYEYVEGEHGYEEEAPPEVCEQAKAVVTAALEQCAEATGSEPCDRPYRAIVDSGVSIVPECAE